MAQSGSYRRRQLLVGKSARRGLWVNRLVFDRSYQFQFVTRLCLITFALIGISALIAMLILWKVIYRPELKQQANLVAALVGVVLTALIAMVISVPVVYYLGMRQSHQVVGPLKRITRVLGAIGSGDFSQRLILRPNDVLESVAKSVNRMAENLQKRFSKSS